MVHYLTKSTVSQLAESGGEALYSVDVSVKRGADVASDHHLLLGTIKVKLRPRQDLTCRPHYRYNTQNLKNKEITETFSCSVMNRYSALEFVEEDVDSHWTALKHTWQESSDEVLGKRRKSQKERFLAETWNLITQRKQLKVEISRCTAEQTKKSKLTSRYWQLNKDVGKSAKKDKREFFNTCHGSRKCSKTAKYERLLEQCREREADHPSQLRTRKALPSLKTKNKEQHGWNLSRAY